ncbi:MAG: zinc-ribbon domain containing protein [Chloroflexi bacterium]|nr:zinc-ribbon domain containing protein [Chloroflexota bacterium]
MAIQDKLLTCTECGQTFTFTAGEQEFFQTKGYTNEPKRCPSCRQSRRGSRSNGGSFPRADRQMFSAVCAECGKEALVPFEPRSGRPVYCSDCFRQNSTPRRSY